MNDPAPGGDVELLLGPPANPVKVCVQSVVLALASPVFKTLLGPDFAEGNVTSSNDSLWRVSLPEDDPETMIWICKALHLHRDMCYNFPLPALELLAAHIDKYDLADALRG